MSSTIIITSADAKFFDLVRGTILSIREQPQGESVDIGFIDIGCTPQQLKWISRYVDHIVEGRWEFEFPGIENAPRFLQALLARPLLPQYFPGYETYIWIDADAWVQHWFAIDLLIQGALRATIAAVPEIDRGAVGQCYVVAEEGRTWRYTQYSLYYSQELAYKYSSYPSVNAGVFAIRRGSEIWKKWLQNLQYALGKHVDLWTDQTALNFTIYHDLNWMDDVEMLPAYCNWSCHTGFPAWDPLNKVFVEPYLPYHPIGILHLTARTKSPVKRKVKSTQGGLVDVSLRYRGNEQQDSLARHDYIFPAFKKIFPDQCFPNMRVEYTYIAQSRWPYLRREIPHLFYVDQRDPSIGFVTRDEAHILYNTALQFRGKSALEIGCWMGWSTAHLAAGGVILDVVDPLLDNPEVYESIDQSLSQLGVRSSVTLHAGFSPEKVEEIAQSQNRRWHLIFIDGDHDHSAPLRDAQIAEKYAAEDALILLYGLNSPDVAAGLNYLRDRGWNTMIYQTMQIMGVAWRGNVQPVEHIPDPAVQWTLPEHLKGYRVAGSNLSPGLARGQAWKTGLPKQAMDSIQQGTLSYQYKGIPTLKNPFDLALYPLLIWRLKPKTIVEIGSFQGGSALWLGDLCTSFGLDTHIYSIDVNRVKKVSHPKVTYLSGSGRALGEVLTTSFLSRLPRPLLVIEDADHQYETTIRVLEFFHQHLLPGEYVVVEGGIVSDMEGDAQYNGGPNRALREFLWKYEQDYDVDENYCNFFGPNFTWCINGYLRKTERSLLRLDLDFRTVYAAVKPFTLLSVARLYNLYSLAKKVCEEDIPGNFVECGVCRGGATALLAWVIQRYSRRPRKVYAFDTFSGMPEPADVDRHEGIPAPLVPYGKAGDLAAPIAENLEKVCKALGVWDLVTPVEGLFSDTLPACREEVGEIALLHADSDWYSSTMDIFHNLYTQLNPQGFVQLDDYDWWEGCKKAVHDFEQETEVFFQLHTHTVDWVAAWFTPSENLPILSGEQAEAAPAGIRLSRVNLVLFPDWDPDDTDVLVSELEPVLEFVLLSPNPQDYALVVAAELDYGMAESVLEMAAANVTLRLLEQGREIPSEPWISLVRTLNAHQWERLLARMTYHCPLGHERFPARIQPAVAQLPRFELPAGILP